MAFDIDKYTSTSKKVVWGDLDFEQFKSNPLPESTLRSIRYMADIEYHTVCYLRDLLVTRYMADIEYHTVCYLRDLLVTPSHKEADVSAFMTMWNREEFWHGEALSAVLAAHGVTLDFDQLKATRLKLGWKDRLDPIKQSLLGNIVGKDFIAVHMIWGAANEWSAVAAYNRMADLEQHPVLAELLRRIAKQEARHVAFYATQARERLGKSKKAQILARFALKNAWGPVGSSVMEPAEVTHVMGHIFGGPEGLREIRKLDEHISRMPGLEGLTIVENSLRNKYGYVAA